MIVVKIKDRRYHKGYNIKFFQTNTITEEIVQFVKDNPKVYHISGYDMFCHGRDEFLKTFSGGNSE